MLKHDFLLHFELSFINTLLLCNFVMNDVIGIQCTDDEYVSSSQHCTC